VRSLSAVIFAVGGAAALTGTRLRSVQPEAEG
jgi:hypothetical protein